jgi:hypothetical protein
MKFEVQYDVDMMRWRVAAVEGNLQFFWPVHNHRLERDTSQVIMELLTVERRARRAFDDYYERQEQGLQANAPIRFDYRPVQQSPAEAGRQVPDMPEAQERVQD